MRVLVAAESFSGALDAVQATAVITRGWLGQAPETAAVARAMCDGSSELVAVVHAAVGGRVTSLTAGGPLGEPVPASLLHVPGPGGGTVYLDAGHVLGRQLTPPDAELNCARSGTSRGLGELLVDALDLGAGRIVVGLGEAASHDGGAGLLSVLAGQPAERRPAERARPAEYPAGPTFDELEVARDRLAAVDVVVATASTPLLGLHGAGAQLADRPGIDATEAQRIDTAVAGYVAELARLRTRLPRVRQPLAMAGDAGAHRHGAGTAAAPRPGRGAGSGAGGGVGQMLEILGARLLPGAEVVARSVRLDEAVADADLVITGRSVLDAAALDSGVVATVGQAAMAHGLPVVVLAEDVRTSRREVARAGISATYETGRHASGPQVGLEYWARRVARTWARTA